MNTYHCQNCDWAGPEESLAPFADIAERLEPGDTIPAGECPECGACCWSDEELAKHRLERAAGDLADALEEIIELDPPCPFQPHDKRYAAWFRLLGGDGAARAAIEKARG